MGSERARSSQRPGKRASAPALSARLWPPALAALCGAAFGLGLARTLFEWQPSAALSGWPGALLLTSLAAALAAAAIWRWPRLRADHTLPLALPVLHALAPNVDLLRGWVLLAGALALTGLMVSLPPSAPASPAPAAAPPARRFRTSPDTLLALGLFLVLFALYLRTLAPAVGEADTFEFQVGIARLGIAHGSGYPLLMLVGKVFSLLPLGGTLAWRANLTSAVFGALAAVLVLRLARQLGAGPLPALLAGLVFGVSPTLWSRAVEVEAYTLHAVLVAALLYLSIDLAAAPAPEQKPARLTLLAFLFGLSLTNHLTTLLLAPTCLLAAILLFVRTTKSDREKSRHIGPSSIVRRAQRSSVFLALLLGLSLYLYLPLRWPAINNGQRLSLAQFANIVTGNEAKGAFQWDLPLRDPGRFAIVFDKLQSEYGWPGLAAVAYGVGLLTYAAWHKARRQQAIGLLLLLLPYGAFVYFGLAFNVPDPDFSAFFIPLHLITAVLLGLGAEALLGLITKRLNYKLPIATAQGLLLSLFSLLPLQALWHTLPRVDQSGDWAQYRLGEHILSQPLALGATILADSQKIAPLYYLQVAEGVRPDLDIVVLPDEASYRAALDERLAAGRTVYLGRYLPGLGGGYALRSVGPLAEVAPTPWTTAPLALTPPLQPVNAPATQLLGYAGPNGAELSAAAPALLPVTLAWQTIVPLNENLLVSLRLVDAAGQVAWRSAGSVPVNGLYPTNAWHVGEVISDYHAIPIAHSLPPGRYRLQVGLFPPFVLNFAGWSEVAAVSVRPSTQSAVPPQPLRARLGDQWLLGYALAETAAPAARLPVTLYWLRSAAPEQTVTAFGQTRSLAAWPPGQVVPLVYELPVPASGESLPVSVDTGQAARCGWLAPVRAACPLPSVRLAGQAAAEGARNFDNQLLLNAAVLETPTAAPGGQVRVTLIWQGLRRMTEDYTVFVHLLGPDGLVHGQVDAWPVSGTQATSTWAPGQPIHDAYTLQAPADAPPGDYQVEIGLYLLATGQRLPLLNAAGEVVDDRVLVEGLRIGN